MRAAVLSIGTELTRGELVNSNAAWLADRLTSLGFEVVEHVTVDDDVFRIVQAMGRLSSEVSVVVGTGGLGPTSDDRTCEAAAQALGVERFRDEATLDKIRRKWESRGAEMPASNEKQADFPEGAQILANPTGTAPGFAVTLSECRFFFMPGVPAEMHEMFEQGVKPSVAPLCERTTCQIHIRSFGMTESQVGDVLADVESMEDGITIGYRASFPEIEVKVLARAETESEAEDKARRVADEVRSRLGDAAYGERDDTFAGVVGRAMRAKGWSLAVAESCTGGMIGELLTSVPGSSDYLLLDAVTYANSAKSKILGVQQDTLRAHGAVSEEVAAAMAEGARRVADADLAVAVTGIAGPGGGSEDKPVGTVWLALARRDGETRTKHYVFPGDRERIRTLAAYVALRMIWRAVNGNHRKSE